MENSWNCVFEFLWELCFVLLCVMFSCVFVTFPYDASGQVCYLILLIPDLWLLVYFYNQA